MNLIYIDNTVERWPRVREKRFFDGKCNVPVTKAKDLLETCYFNEQTDVLVSSVCKNKFAKSGYNLH